MDIAAQEFNAPKKRRRMGWMDALRGIAIIMVVYLHSADSMFLKFQDLSPVFLQINSVLTPFRMPALMFLSGLLIAGSLRKGAHRYFRGKIFGILYPYIMWSIVSYGLFIFRSYYNGKPMVDFWTSLIFEPMAYLWFIYYIFLYYIIAFFALRCHWGVCLASVAVFYALLYDSEYARFAYYLPFFMVGGVLGCKLQSFKNFIDRSDRMALILVVSMVIWMYLAHAGIVTVGEAYYPISMIMAFAIIMILLRIVTWRRADTFLRPFEWFGRNSLVIFLVHFPFTWVAPVVMSKMLAGNANIIFPFYFAVVLGVSSLMAIFNNRSRVFSLLFTANAFFELRSLPMQGLRTAS